MLVLIDDSYFESENVAVVRPVDDGEEQAIIFVIGSSVIDGGFLVDVSVEEVVSLLNGATVTELAGRIDDRINEPLAGDNPPSIDDDAVVDLGT